MRWRTLWGRLALGVIVGAAIVWVVTSDTRFDAGTVERQVEALGLWAPVGFVALYALAAVLFLPGLVMSLAGGALFGPLWGSLYNIVGATIGATLAFLVARYLLGDWVMRKAGGRASQLIDGVEAEGWRFVAFARLVPVFPFNLLNYALGLTRIPLVTYVVASAVCMFPGAVAYTWLGYAGREAAVGGESMIRNALLALGLIAAVAFLPRFVRRLRNRS